MSATPRLDAATAALQTAGHLQDVDWDQVAPGDLPATVALIARVSRLAEAALVAAAGRLEATGAAGELGWATAKDFLTHITGGYQGTGGGLVRLAEQVADLPDLERALQAGQVCLAQARTIARHVGTLPRVEELRATAATTMLAQVADDHANATDLDRRFPDVIGVIDPDGTLLGSDRSKDKQERGAHGARFLGFTRDAVGGVKVRGYATIEEAEAVKTALMSLAAPRTTTPGACGGDPARYRKRDPQGRRLDPGCPEPVCAHTGADPRDHGTRMWDALVELCDRATAADVLPTSHGTSTRVVVIIDAHDLTHGRTDDPAHDPVGQRPASDQAGPPASPHTARRPRRGYGHLLSGDTLSTAAVRRMACDAEIIPAVLGTAGEILDVPPGTHHHPPTTSTASPTTTPPDHP